jgi:hypothetical protein
MGQCYWGLNRISGMLWEEQASRGAELFAASGAGCGAGVRAVLQSLADQAKLKAVRATDRHECCAYAIWDAGCELGSDGVARDQLLGAAAVPVERPLSVGYPSEDALCGKWRIDVLAVKKGMEAGGLPGGRLQVWDVVQEGYRREWELVPYQHMAVGPAWRAKVVPQ